VKFGRRELLYAAAGVLAATLAGLAASLLLSVVLGTLSRISNDRAAVAAMFTIAFASLFAVPIGMGIFAAYFWSKFAVRVWQIFAFSLVTTAVAVLGAYLFFNEGYICLLIASPLVLLLIVVGATIGHRTFAARFDRLNAFVLPLVFIAMVADAGLRTSRAGVVVDELVVKASAAEVWKHVVAFPKITARPTYWLNRIGLPAPSETTCAGAFVGADRACIFTNGLVFKERISELERERLLTFDIVEQPRDPELLGHLDLHRGQFELRPNADGTTTLIGRSWYTLHVRPHWYFDWWTRDITREVHLRVMRHIKALAENGA
jgi:hypothetical protein